MNTSNKTILITGGSAGIGFATAQALSGKGNRIIITGREASKLQAAVAAVPELIPFQGDVTLDDDRQKLAQKVREEYGQLDILVNNAGQAYVYDLASDTDVSRKATDELNTNFLSVLRLNELLLPLLRQSGEAAIVHVTSIVAFVPGFRLATYSASKAALHSYSLSLRASLQRSTAIKVFELMPPLVNTAFSKEIGGENGMPPEEVAAALLQGLEDNMYEIRPGQTEALYLLSRQSPEEALNRMNAAEKQ